MVARLTDSGQGAPAWTRRRRESKRLVGPELVELQDALQVGRHQEGGGRAVPAQRIAARWPRRSGSGWPASRPRATSRSRSGWRPCGTSASRPGGGRPGRTARPRPRPRTRLGRSPRPTGRWSRLWGGPWCPRCSAWAGSAGRGELRRRTVGSGRPARPRSKTRQARVGVGGQASRSASVSVALSSTGMSPTRAAPRTAQIRSADEPRAKATRSPRVQPRASSAPAARRWRASASAASSSSTRGGSRGHGGT